MDLVNCTPGKWYENENDFSEAIKNETIWNKIPLLNVNDLHNFKDLQLVRFRGMIQDMHGPEFYLEKFEVLNEDTKETFMKVGKYIDIYDCKTNETIDTEGPNNVRAERQTLVVISIPAVNSWVTKMEEEKFKLVSEPTSSEIQTKRPLEAMEIDQTDPQEDQTELTNKRQCTEVTRREMPLQNLSQEYLLNFPIPDRAGKVCHLKVYKSSEMLKLNSVCEFVGFLSVNPSLACQESDEGMDEIEFQVHNPPPSLIPKIHCVSFKEFTHNNPLIGEMMITAERMQFLKKELLILFTQLFLGDQLAAEYMIYHLISEVYLRKDFMALGKLSLNISNIPTFENHDFAQELYKFIELLVVKSHYLPMTLENMNSLTFIPKKDYTCDRLTTSTLQLASNTHIVFDETKLTAGKLNEGGVRGVKAFTNIIKNQKIPYDFTYYEVEFDCDIPLLVLSEGKSMLPSDIQIPLEPDEMHLKTFSEILQAARHFLKPELLNEMRVYLTSARLTKYEISDSVQELVQNDFVDMRQGGNVSGDDLHGLLVLARLVCISQGKNVMDEECWKKACELEQIRRERLKKSTNSV